jgi:uncharacterized RDD family membrane protein YckC
VRRGTPDVVRLRGKPARRRTPDEPGLALEPDPKVADALAAFPAEPAVPVEVESRLASAAPLDRVAAGLIDLVVILSVDAAVLDLTLKVAGLGYAEWRVLPWAPLVGFYALLNGGYFATFTAAGGQTIGKMLRRIRVVGAHGSLHAGQVVLRTAAYLASALPAGLGFVAGLVGAERLALHDRLADTRVVKVATP